MIERQILADHKFSIDHPLMGYREFEKDPSTLVGTLLPMGDALRLGIRFVSQSPHHGRREAAVRIIGK